MIITFSKIFPKCRGSQILPCTHFRRLCCGTHCSSHYLRQIM